MATEFNAVRNLVPQHFPTLEDLARVFPVFGVQQTLAATGNSSQSGAALIASTNTKVTSASSILTGVRLPTGAAYPGPRIIYNSSVRSVNLYPASGETLNGGSADAPVVIPSLTAAVVYPDDPTTGGWVVINNTAASITAASPTFTGTVTLPGTVVGTSATTLAIAGAVGSSAVGSPMSLTGGAGNGAFAGGAVTVVGGASGAGATGAGGAASVTGGAAASTNGAGGAVALAGGAGAGTGAGGAAAVTAGASGAGATGNGGAASLTAGAATSTAGTGGAVTITSGLGTTTGNGGTITVTGGAGGATSGNGGSILLVPGALGGTGVAGAVYIRGALCIPTLAAQDQSGTTPTLTGAEIAGVIISCTQATAVTATLDTGAAMDTAFPGATAGDSFRWSIVNLGSSTGVVTVTASSGHTVVGLMTIAITTSASFISRRVSANTWVTYRV